MNVRAVLGGVGGLLAAVVVIAGVQALNFVLFPPPPGLDLEDPAVMATILDVLPTGALVMLELSYALGSVVGGAVAMRIASSWWPPIAVGVVLTLLDVANLMSLPHPWWLAALTLVTFVPGAVVGAWGYTIWRPILS